MNKLVFASIVLGSFAMGMVGCADTAKVERKTTITTPEGTTTTTTQQKVEKTGSNPPASQP